MTPTTQSETIASPYRALELQAIELHGSQSQKERGRAGMLPESELIELAHRELFRDFADFERWHRGKALPRLRARFFVACGDVDEEHVTAPVLSAKEWEALARINRVASKTATHAWLSAPITSTTYRLTQIGRAHV